MEFYQKLEAKERLRKITERIDACGKELLKENSVEEKKKEKESNEKEKTDNISNVVYIAPSIITTFELMGTQGTPQSRMTLMEIVFLLETWADEIESLIEKNKGHYKNQALLLHVSKLMTIISFAVTKLSPHVIA